MSEQASIKLNILEQINTIDPEGNDYFFDWFCKDTVIPRKSKSLMSIVRRLVSSDSFDATQCRTFFKNLNSGEDLIYLIYIQYNDLVYLITLSVEGRFEVHCEEDDSKPVQNGAWEDLLDYFGVVKS